MSHLTVTDPVKMEYGGNLWLKVSFIIRRYATRVFLEISLVLIRIVNFNMAGHSKNLDENVNQFAKSLIQRGHRAINHVWNLDILSVFIRLSLHFCKIINYYLFFRLLCNFQALMPFAASPTFGLLYRSTVAYFPQAFLFLIIGVYLLVEYNEF